MMADVTSSSSSHQAIASTPCHRYDTCDEIAMPAYATPTINLQSWCCNLDLWQFTTTTSFVLDGT
jgi:hypothetical protein